MTYDNLDLAILKTLITNKKYALEFASDCDIKILSSDIYIFANEIVKYLKIYKELPTLRILTEKLEKGGNTRLVEHIKEIWNIAEKHNYDTKEFKHDLSKIKKRYADKQLYELNRNLNKSLQKDIEFTKQISDIQKIVSDIKSLDKIRSYECKTLREAIPEFRDEYNLKHHDPKFQTGVKTGYSVLDDLSGGLQAGELLIIGGESNSGKSIFLLNLAVNIWLGENNINMETDFKQGQNVLYFSLEMPYKPCLNRTLAKLACIPSKQIRKGSLNKDDANKLRTSLQFINNYPYEFNIIDIPRGATVEQIERLYEESKDKFDPKVIVVDYLGLMDDDSPDTAEQDWLKLGKITGKLHEMLRTHNIIGLTAVQLNRTKATDKNPEERIGLNRIGRSSLIMTHANIGIQIETRPNEKNYPDMYYHMIKVRDGELGKGRLLKNMAAATLIDDKPETDNKIAYEFRNFDDISEKAEFFDI